MGKYVFVSRVTVLAQPKGGGSNTELENAE